MYVAPPTVHHGQDNDDRATPRHAAWRWLAAPIVQPWCVQFDAREFDQAQFEHAGIVCPPDVARAVRKRQAEFFHGRLCARAALAALGLPDAHVGIGSTREPVWPYGLVGSITHTSDLAAAVVVPANCVRGVGIDIEIVTDKDSTIDALRATALTSSELQRLMTVQDTLGSTVPVLLAFSAKKSFFKAVFCVVRHLFDFDMLELMRFDMAANAMEFRVRETLAAQWPAGRMCRIPFCRPDPGHVATMFTW